MFISRISLNPKAAEEDEFWRSIADPYSFHQAIWALFSDGPERKRDFIYRHDGKVTYAISSRPPVLSHKAFQVECKPFEPKLKAGQRLSFMLRVNPVVSRRDENGRQSRHDLVMEQKHRLRQQGVNKTQWPSQYQMIQSAGRQWIEPRSQANGFEIEPLGLLAENYRQQRFPQKSCKVTIAVMDLSGNLVIRQPGLFEEMLYNGLGPAKGFGCGLMLIRRV